MTDPLAVFEAERTRFKKLFGETLAAAEPIVPSNVEIVEEALVRFEVEGAERALEKVGPPPSPPASPEFARQAGTTCMSVSLANGLISLGEPWLLADRDKRAVFLADDVVASTSSLGKPGEYRSVDDLFKYLESGRLAELEQDGAKLAHDYRVRLTSSLLDVCQALWTGKGRLVVQRRAHARLAFAIDFEQGKPLVRMRDPMDASGPGFDRVSLDKLRREFIWSPLKKVPRILGPGGIPSLTAKEALAHLERYDGMQNLGVDCPSAIVYRKEDAPPLFPTPPEETKLPDPSRPKIALSSPDRAPAPPGEPG